MKVTVEIGAVSKDNADYFHRAARELEDSHTYMAADVLHDVATAMEAQMPIKPGVYRIKQKTAPQWQGFYEFDGQRWWNGHGVHASSLLADRSDFEVLEFIGTREGQDD